MRIREIIITIGILLFLTGSIILSWYPGQLLLGLLLIAFLPGYALLTALWPHLADSPLTWPEQWLLAVAVSYGLTVTLLLLLVLVRLPLNALSVMAGLGGMTLVFAFIAWRRMRLKKRLEGGLIVIIMPSTKPSGDVRSFTKTFRKTYPTHFLRQQIKRS